MPTTVLRWSTLRYVLNEMLSMLLFFACDTIRCILAHPPNAIELEKEFAIHYELLAFWFPAFPSQTASKRKGHLVGPEYLPSSHLPRKVG
jgi:hypothetical protein